MIKRTVYNFIPLLLIFLFTACEEENTSPSIDNGLIELASGELPNINLRIKVFSASEVQVGYNRLQIQLIDRSSESTVTDANVRLIPMMHMTHMTHTTPVSIPDTEKMDNMYQRDVIFIMPSGEMGYWELTAAIEIPSTGMKDTASLEIDVALPQEAKLQSFISKTDSSSLFLSLVEPLNPIVGANDFTLTLHKRQNMMSFPPVEDLIVEIEPEMPTMGHGSEGNVNPDHVGKGFYEGTVSFNMSGFWRINVWVKDKENREVGKTAFEITF